MVEKPRVEKELAKAQENLERFEKEIKDLSFDRLNEAPRQESELAVSQNQLSKKKEIYLKPKRTLPCKAAFNEKYRSDYEFSSQMVGFIAQNNEVIGETISLWTKPFAGIPYEEWDVPVNTPVWGPRYLAEQIKGRSYHRFSMQDRAVSADGMGTYTGSMIVENTVQRLDAHPHSPKKSIFMGTEGF